MHSARSNHAMHMHIQAHTPPLMRFPHPQHPHHACSMPQCHLFYILSSDSCSTDSDPQDSFPFKKKEQTGRGGGG